MYPALYNLLDFTAGTVPVTHVTLEDEKECAAVYPAHEDFWAKAICTQFSNDTVRHALFFPRYIQVCVVDWASGRCTTCSLAQSRRKAVAIDEGGRGVAARTVAGENKGEGIKNRFFKIVFFIFIYSCDDFFNMS
jgi:hypothetical protein